jgi:light-regulated signal transduction histidine kinase (bacteriophytochrome)
MEPKAQKVDDGLAELARQADEVRTELEQTKDALRAAQAEIAHQTEAARTASDELQQFVYAASHDLQEPLRSISAYTQLLQRRIPNDAEAAELSSFILDGINRMSALIRDLLNYSRVANQLRPSTFGLSSTVQWALLKLAEPIRASQAQIVYTDLPEVNADESRIASVLENLLSNSIKYRRDEPPRIEIQAEEGDSAYIIAVKDNGQGIDPVFHKQIFIPFKRLHGKEIPGTGLGLAICKKIVEAHGGKIWIESEANQGSIFKFTIPF